MGRIVICPSSFQNKQQQQKKTTMRGIHYLETTPQRVNSNGCDSISVRLRGAWLHIPPGRKTESLHAVLVGGSDSTAWGVCVGGGGFLAGPEEQRLKLKPPKQTAYPFSSWKKKKLGTTCLNFIYIRRSMLVMP